MTCQRRTVHIENAIDRAFPHAHRPSSHQLAAQWDAIAADALEEWAACEFEPHHLRRFTVFGGSGEVWTEGELMTSLPGYITGYIYDDDGEIIARTTMHVDNIEVIHG